MALIDGKQSADNSIADVKLISTFIKPDGSVVYVGSQSMSGVGRITDALDAVNPQDYVTLSQFQKGQQGFFAKEPVLYATLLNITDFTTKATVEGALDTVSLSAPILVDGDRVLVKNQVIASENGLYRWDNSGGQLVRSADADEDEELRGGTSVFVTAGDNFSDAGFVISDPDGTINPGVDNHTWSQYTGVSSIIARDALNKSGTNLDVVPGNGLEISGGQFSGGPITVTPHTDGSTGVDASGVKAAVPIRNDKGFNPSVTSGDEADTGVSIGNTPAGQGYVQVFVSGVIATVGDGVKTEDCYFSDDGGTTAKNLTTIAAGDTLYWNGVIVGHDLDGNDVIDFHYNYIL